MGKVSLAGAIVVLCGAGCARVAVEGGEKPIHIVLDVNVRVARELDDFFDFEDKHPATAPNATQPGDAATSTTHPH